MITGQFKNIDGDTISVTINTSGDDIIIGDNNNGTGDIYFSDNEPVVISQDVSDTFERILKTTCSIRLVVKKFIPELFSPNDREISVSVTGGDVNFYGYVTPNTYTQPYAEVYTDLTVNCQDFLCTLENHKYKESEGYDDAAEECGNVSFKDMIINILGTDKNILFDNSIKLDSSGTSVLEDAGVNEYFIFGEEKDDWESCEDVLDVILKYLNLHIILINNIFYIFNYETKRSSSITNWIVLQGTAETPSISSLENCGKYIFYNDTTISLSEVYNSFKITCNLEEQENLISSPLDDDNMYSPFTNVNIFCLEYNGQEEALEDEEPKKHDWYIQYYDSTNWTFLYYDGSEVKNVSDFVKYYDGTAIDLTDIFKNLTSYPLIPILFKAGSTDAATDKDNSIIKIPDMGTYLVISVNGSKNSENSSETIEKWNNIIDKTGGIIKYSMGSVSSITPTDSAVTNYIVISGKLLLLPAITYPYYETLTGVKVEWDEGDDSEEGFVTVHRTMYLTQEEYDDLTANENEKGTLPMGYGSYHETWGVSWEVLRNPEELYCSWYIGESPVYPLATDLILKNAAAAPDEANMIPPLTYDIMKTKFKEEYGDWFIYTDENSKDTISKVPILVCQLKIGDKYCVETSENNFEWLTQGQCDKYTYEDADGNTQTGIEPTFAVGINPKIDDYLLCTVFDIPDTVSTIEKDGMAIPIKSTDSLSGNVEFKILGPSYTGWNQQIRRHPTMFRHTKWWTTELPLMEYVLNIFILNFGITVVSDNANINNIDYKDLVYMSESNDKSIRECEDISFEISTGLTTLESIDKAVNTTPKKNNVFNINTGKVVTSLYRASYPDLTKAEEFYITDYYNEYSAPKIQLDSTLKADETTYWNLYKFNFFSDKTFYPISYKYDIKENKNKFTLKEI